MHVRRSEHRSGRVGARKGAGRVGARSTEFAIIIILLLLFLFDKHDEVLHVNRSIR
jgi:hypothetical protein